MAATNGLKPGADGKLPQIPEPKKKAMEQAPAEHEGGDEGTSLHANGDGSYHTMNGGEQTEHPSLGHALMHMAAKHEPEAKHMHVKHDGAGMQSSHVSEGGEPEGPHDHENIEALKQHMDKFLSEEEAEGGYEPEESGNEGVGLKGFGG